MSETVNYQECSKCGERKPLTPEFFQKAKSCKTGFRKACKSCRNKQSNKRREENIDEHKKKEKEYYNRTKEERLEYSRNYYNTAKDTEEYKKRKHDWYTQNREERRDYFKEYYSKNKDLVNQKNRDYYKENKEWFFEYKKNWNQENRDLLIFYSQKRRAKVRELEHSLTDKEWKMSLGFFNQSCAYCGDSTCKLEQEHITPVNKGGGYTAQNIIPSCRSCNASKNAQDLIEWYVNSEQFDENKLEHILDYVELTKGE